MGEHCADVLHGFEWWACQPAAAALTLVELSSIRSSSRALLDPSNNGGPQWVGFDAPLGKVAVVNVIALAAAGALVLVLAVYALLRVMGGGA